MQSWTYGTNLRDARKALGLSQEEVARRLDVKLGTYGSWERGTHGPQQARTLAAIVEVLKVPPEAVGLDAPKGWEFVPADWIREQNSQTHEMLREIIKRLERIR